jgi:hypothetical protein
LEREKKKKRKDIICPYLLSFSVTTTTSAKDIMPITALGFEGSANKVAVGIVRDGEVRSFRSSFHSFPFFFLSIARSLSFSSH